MSIYQTLRKYKSARSFMFFSMVFYIAMYISKTVHALWFDVNDSLSYFGFSYTMMAVAGTLSFFTGRISDITSPSFALKSGVITYSIGLILRIYTHSFIIAGASGFIAGLGASLVIISLRHWILSIGSEADRPSIIAIKEASTNIGVTVGTSISGLLVAIMAYLLEEPLVSILIFSALICFLTIYLVPTFPKKNEPEIETMNKEKNDFRKYKLLVFGTIVFGVIGGLSVSLMNPFIPIILKEQGLSISLIGIFMAAISLTSVLSSPLFSNKKINDNKHYVFFVCEFLAGLLILLFITPLMSITILFVLILRALFQTGSIITQELMELEIYPKHYLGFLFGISQSSFFVGDALGGTFAGYVYSIDMNYGLIICAGLFIFNALVFPIFFKVILRKNGRKVNEFA